MGERMKNYQLEDLTQKMLHEETVEELSFSVDQFTSPEALIGMLEPYDLDIVWMQLHTGELTNFSPTSSGESLNKLIVYNALGLIGESSTSDDFLSSGLSNQVDRTNSKESQEIMIENMETLLSDKLVSYYEEFLGLRNLENAMSILQTMDLLFMVRL